jgi:hypothetical protein
VTEQDFRGQDFAGQDLTQQTGERAPKRRHGPDLYAMMTGVGALFVSAYILTDGAGWFSSMSPRWTLAVGAVLIGVLLLLASLRKDRR